MHFWKIEITIGIWCHRGRRSIHARRTFGKCGAHTKNSYFSSLCPPNQLAMPLFTICELNWAGRSIFCAGHSGAFQPMRRTWESHHIFLLEPKFVSVWTKRLTYRRRMHFSTLWNQAHAYLVAMRINCRCWPGNVFKNIIESNGNPVVTLKTIFRQAQASSIVKDAHLINKSIAPSNMRNVTVNKDGSSLNYESLVSAINERRCSYWWERRRKRSMSLKVRW